MSSTHLPLVTVFITTYNNELFIADAIESILSQTFQNFELLVVNDGSTDNTSNILASFSDSRIKVLKNHENKGIVFSRNLALGHARGQYLAVLDGDDIALPDRLQKQVDYFENRPNLGLLGGQAYGINEQGERNGRILNAPNNPKYVNVRLFFENPFIHSCIMMRTNVFRHIGGYPILPLSVTEDLALYIKIAAFCDVDNLLDYIVEYRRHDTNVTRSHFQDVNTMLIILRNEQIANIGVEYSSNNAEMLLKYAYPNTFTIDSYKRFLSTLILKNRETAIYDFFLFEKFIYQMWYQILMTKAPNKSTILLRSLPHYSTAYLQRSQILESFKRFIFPRKRALKVVKVLGGLGNQMFQYAFFLALKQQGHPVKLDIKEFEDYPLHNGLELASVFNLDLDVISKKTRELFLKKKGDNLFLRLKRRIYKTRKAFKTEETLFAFHPHYLTNSKPVYYWGYWQHEDYLLLIKESVRKAFTFPPIEDKKNIEIKALIQKSHSVAVHVRRGDYLQDELLGGNCDLDYYLRGISFFEKKVNNPVFFFFSDDIKWCREMFGHTNASFVSWNTGKGSYIDMHLMSLCRHQIISNSSFSWWAAWLNMYKEKNVIAPKNWVNDSNLDTTGLTMNFILM